jgi:hypothetical protein
VEVVGSNPISPTNFYLLAHDISFHHHNDHHNAFGAVSFVSCEQALKKLTPRWAFLLLVFDVFCTFYLVG